ncbi:hypothetical protein QG516_04700 [Pedobacter gandavensis]|uniref:hypothetical protein n=1 Tax=Pedobacter TaxID=84567 RepID=UPI001C99B817|nr:MULTISPECIES: hypothetical protein [Pedobacter]WGQ10952.1 hypothetical protein QG516_04700 [Pedobacter gandavensis]
MNTKLIMTLTAILLAIIGIVLSFAPDLVMKSLDLNNSAIITLILQLLGGAYCAFALLNWMAKGALIGGIYNKPIAMGNFTHFVIVGLALTKAVLHNQQLPIVFSIMAGCFVILACVFWVIISRHPIKK